MSFIGHISLMTQSISPGPKDESLDKFGKLSIIPCHQWEAIGIKRHNAQPAVSRSDQALKRSQRIRESCCETSGLFKNLESGMGFGHRETNILGQPRDNSCALRHFSSQTEMCGLLRAGEHTRQCTSTLPPLHSALLMKLCTSACLSLLSRSSLSLSAALTQQ